MVTENELTARAAAVGQALHQRGLLLAAAESCTGGMFLSRLIDIPGSSAYVAGGVVCYSNAVKMQVVGVQAATLAAYGAVSEPTAREMAEGICRVIGAPLGISITGVAGPDGGTPEKPVGLVYIGLATPLGTQVQRYVWAADRTGNRALSVLAACDLILAYCAVG